MLIFIICWKLHPLQVFKLMMRNFRCQLGNVQIDTQYLNIYFVKFGLKATALEYYPICFLEWGSEAGTASERDSGSQATHRPQGSWAIWAPGPVHPRRPRKAGQCLTWACEARWCLLIRTACHALLMWCEEPRWAWVQEGWKSCPVLVLGLRLEEEGRVK